MIRRILIAAASVAVLVLSSLWLLAQRSAIPPLDNLREAHFSAELVARGEVLSAEGHCASCHTAPGGPAFGGGYGVNTPFGIIYGTNITPDPKSGIGLWSLKAFARAMREGVSRDGSHLFPAFPYYAFTKLSDDDMEALYAYLMTRPAANVAVPANTLPFPLKLRVFQDVWKRLFVRAARFSVDRSKSAVWNRGAYLAEALADCSGCHTPRNALGAEETSKPYAGYEVDGWFAPALTAANPSPIPWTEEELFQYLRKGASPLHGATGAASPLMCSIGVPVR